jgi:hypothetical protein
MYHITHGLRPRGAPAAGTTVSAVWWSFGSANHLHAWSSGRASPTFLAPTAGTFPRPVKITHTGGSTETVRRTDCGRAA